MQFVVSGAKTPADGALAVIESLEKRAAQDRETSQRQRSIKQARYWEGRAAALTDAVEFWRTVVFEEAK